MVHAPDQISDKYRTASIVYACMMIAFGILVTMGNVRLSRLIRSTRKAPKLIKVQKMLHKSRRTIKNGKLSPVETILLATEAGMTIDQMRSEYSKENLPLQETLEYLFGSVDHHFFDRLKNTSRFIEVGYANQAVFLELNKNGSLENANRLKADDSYKLCKTQSIDDTNGLNEKTRRILSKKNGDKPENLALLISCKPRKIDDAT